MKVKDVRLHLKADHWLQQIVLRDQDGNRVCAIYWEQDVRTKAQAFAIAKRLCDRFNEGQQK